MRLALVLNENERKERFKVSIEKRKLEENVATVSEDITRSTVPGQTLEIDSAMHGNNESSRIIPLSHSSIPTPMVVPITNNLLQNSLNATLSRNSAILHPEENRSEETILAQHLPSSYLPLPPLEPLPFTIYDSNLPTTYQHTLLNTSGYAFTDAFEEIPGDNDKEVYIPKAQVANFSLFWDLVEEYIF